MTVGQELKKITNLKLFHNHMTIELVSEFFNYGTDEGRRLVTLFRKEIFEAVSKSDLAGLIFTYVWAFDIESDREYIESVSEIFESQGADVFWVELEADYDERFIRNKTPNRLEHKQTKRDLEQSEQMFASLEKCYRLNSLEGEIKRANYIRINNTDLPPDEVAEMIKQFFSL